MKANAAEFSPFLPSPFERYLEHMKLETSWGSDAELKAISDEYRSDVFSSSATPLTLVSSVHITVFNAARVGNAEGAVDSKEDVGASRLQTLEFGSEYEPHIYLGLPAPSSSPQIA